jgi:hypothetical protein
LLSGALQNASSVEARYAFAFVQYQKNLRHLQHKSLFTVASQRRPNTMSIQMKISILQWLMVSVAAVSVFGSLAVIICIARHKARRNIIFHRLLGSMSICDFLASFGMALGPIPVPADLGFPNTFGTRATCTAQAVMVNVAGIGYWYAACLSVYYVLSIRFRLRDAFIAKYVEPIMHLVTLGWGFTQTALSLHRGIFNPTTPGSNCWLGTYPPGCQYDNSCTRGQNFAHDFLTLHTIPGFINYGILFMSLAVVIFTVRSIIYRTIRRGIRRARQESVQSRHSNSTGGSDSHVVSATGSCRPGDGELSAVSLDTACIGELQTPTDGKLSSPPVGGVAAVVEDLDETDKETTYARTFNQPSSDISPTPITNVSLPKAPQLNTQRIRQQRSLNLAMTQCILYGFAYLFCLTWTMWLGILDLRDKDSVMFSQYYWVSQPTLRLICENISTNLQ